jgi:hypothetical protein
MTPVWVNSEIISAEKIFSPTDRPVGRSVGRSVGPPLPAADAANAARLSRRR